MGEIIQYIVVHWVEVAVCCHIHLFRLMLPADGKTAEGGEPEK